VRAATGPAGITHFGAVVWDAAVVSAYWERLGFPPFPMQHAMPRADGRYRGEPLSLAFEVGFQCHAQFRYEWISPPPSPPNIYADFLNKHHSEGVQHIGMLVDDLPKSIAALEKLGHHVHQSGAWGDVGKPGSGQYAYMDTDTAGGISLELVRSWPTP
jgi:Glyoxalase/Bleomycin resistance protein/Dioxygenase superfamily